LVVVLATLPLHTLIVELLDKSGKSVKDVELYDSLKKGQEDLSFGDFNKTLMKLEICGVIRVHKLSKGEKTVELI